MWDVYKMKKRVDSVGRLELDRNLNVISTYMLFKAAKLGIPPRDSVYKKVNS